MTDEEEFAARAQLKWTREGDAWILLYCRRRMGRVVPDKDPSAMWRSVKVDGILSLQRLTSYRIPVLGLELLRSHP